VAERTRQLPPRTRCRRTKARRETATQRLPSCLFFADAGAAALGLLVAAEGPSALLLLLLWLMMLMSCIF
jgi:hypothetical protein